MEASLAGQLRTGRGFASAEQQAFLSIVHTADGLLAEAAALLRPHGLSPALFNVLRILRGAGPEGLRCGEIAERLLNRVPDVTRLVDRLVAAGLAERRRSEEDRRAVQVLATDRALGLLGRLDGPMLELHRRQLGHLGARRTADLLRLLRRARERSEGDAT